MAAMRLAGAAWSFVGASLAESADLWRSLGVAAMDVMAAAGGPIEAADIERDPQEQARRLTEPGMALSNLLYIFGDGFEDRAVNSPDSSVRARNRETFQRVLECCAAACIPSLLVLPGVEQPDLSRADALELAARELTEMASLASAAGILLVFEPHVQSILQSPLDTLEFLQRHPDLRIALDYSHFVAQGYTAAEIDPLVPWAGHFHLRQGARGKLQARWDDGEVDFPDAVRRLQAVQYEGFVTLEYEHDPEWMNMDQVDVMTETIKMRDAVRPLLAD